VGSLRSVSRGRPSWESAGTVLTADIAPYENRKLWLLNGAHSLLAYVGSVRGSATVAEAVTDEYCAGLPEEWWATCRRHLPAAIENLSAYCTALTERFANRRMQHALAQIASDGTQKLPVRILPVLRRERGAGRLPEPVVAVLAAWLLHLRGSGAPVGDVRATTLQSLADGPLPSVASRLLGALEPALAEDAELVSAVTARSRDPSRGR
jgi:fructuronate reductase